MYPTMRNKRSNFIPVAIKPTTTPRPLQRPLKKSASCQTDRLVFIKEENLIFNSCSRIKENDLGMKRDYIKAITYINSCHKFINSINEKNCRDKNSLFLLPTITNFAPLFPILLGNKRAKSVSRSIVEEKRDIIRPSSLQETKPKTNVKKIPIEQTPSIGDAGPVGDFRAENQAEIAQIVKEQIALLLSNARDIQAKPLPPKPPRIEELNIVKNTLQELTKIYHCKPKMTEPSKDVSENCSTVPSDNDYEELRKPTFFSFGSVSSLASESSDIKSDSDLETMLPQ